VGRDYVFRTQFEAYGGWADTYLVGGPDEDDDFDGILNGLEFAFYTDPTLATADPVTFSLTAGDVWEIVYPRSYAAVAAGVQFIPEWSDSLPAGGWTNAGVTESILSDDGIVQEVQVTFPAVSGGRQFVRLRVVLP
jgi:hypothetical protein